MQHRREGGGWSPVKSLPGQTRTHLLLVNRSSHVTSRADVRRATALSESGQRAAHSRQREHRAGERPGVMATDISCSNMKPSSLLRLDRGVRVRLAA